MFYLFIVFFCKCVYLSVWLKAAVVWQLHSLLHLISVSSRPSRHILVSYLISLIAITVCMTMPICQTIVFTSNWSEVCTGLCTELDRGYSSLSCKCFWLCTRIANTYCNFNFNALWWSVTMLTLRLWSSGLPDARCSATAHYPWQLHVHGTVSRQLSGTEGRAITSFFPELLEDMAVWTDTGETLTSFSGCTSFRFCYFNNSVKCPCNVIHDSVTLIFTFLIIIIIIR